MTYLLWANTGFEALIGALMIGRPSVFLKSADAVSRDLARSLGFAMFAVSALSGAMAMRHEAPLAGLVALCVFHGGFAISQAISAAHKLSPPPPAVIHAVFLVLFILAALGKI